MTNNSEYLVAYKIPIEPKSRYYKIQVEFFYKSLIAAERRAESIDSIDFVKKDSVKIVRYMRGSVLPDMDGYKAKLPLADGSYQLMNVNYYINAYCE